ncbi:trace amine-associated receptor 13c-like [Aulostomus maculatus]
MARRQSDYLLHVLKMEMENLETSDLCFPEFLNASCRKNNQPLFSAIVTYILLSLISSFTVTLNLLVIISISHYKKLHNQTNFLLLSLAVSDFIVGFLMMFQLALVDGCWFLGDLICTAFYVVDYSVTSASIGNMVLISVDRYVAICDPLHYQTKITEKRVKISIYICWGFSFLYHCVRFKDSLKNPGKPNSCIGECVVVTDYAGGIIDLFLSFIGPVTVIVVLYVRVFVVVVAQAQAMRSHVAVVTLQLSVTPKKSELKAARALGVVILVFLVCVCPYFCVALSGQGIFLNAASATVIICLFYFNSSLNPLIYAVFYPWFRKSVKLIVTLQILEPGSCEVNLLEK